MSQRDAIALLMNRQKSPEDAVAEWNRLRKAGVQLPSLAGIELSDADLCGINLRGVNLHSANLSESNLNGADLSGAELSKANLRSAVMGYADLR